MNTKTGIYEIKLEKCIYKNMRKKLGVYEHFLSLSCFGSPRPKGITLARLKNIGFLSLLHIKN